MDKIVSSLIISYLLNGTNVAQSIWKMHFVTVTPSSVSFPSSYSRMFPSSKHVDLSYALICPKLVHLYAILGAGTDVRILILLSAIYHDHFYRHIYIPGWWGWCTSRGECLCITVSITSWDEVREPEKTAVINLLTEVSCYQMILVKQKL